MYDVVIVGGGVVGCAIARRLSFTPARVALLERAHDVCEGASKGNSGIATAGADTPAGTLETRLVRRSSDGWEALCASLDTPFERLGSLAVALDEDEQRRLPELLAAARANGVEAAILDGDGARRLEPLITPAARAALHVPGDGIVDPIRLTLGYAELAARNGVDVRCGTPATGFHRSGGRITAVATPRGVLATRFVVNAAGVDADEVSVRAGGDAFRSWPRQGQFWLLDRELGRRFTAIVGSVPTALSRGVYCVPTTNRSLLLGPTAVDGEDRSARGVDGETLARVLARARRLVPAVGPEHAIKTFAANRPAGDPVYRVERDGTVPNLIQAAAIRSTGVSSSPAVAERVCDELAEAGAPVAGDRPGALRALPAVPRLLGHPRPEELLAADPRYGQVICACEQVTAAEIAAAFAMRLPPRSLDGVRKRTRAAGGRCQGAVCLAGVSFLCGAYGGIRPEGLAVGEPAARLGVAVAP